MAHQLGRKWTVLGGVLNCVAYGFATWALMIPANAEKNTVTKASSITRIESNRVTLSNLEAFENQVMRDLPVGTAKKDVESYLTRLRIKHDFADAGYGADTGGNTFYGTIEHLGFWLGIFDASLAIRIHIDARDKVDKVWFRVDYL